MLTLSKLIEDIQAPQQQIPTVNFSAAYQVPKNNLSNNASSYSNNANNSVNQAKALNNSHPQRLDIGSVVPSQNPISNTSRI